MGYTTRILVMACMLMVLFYLFTVNNLIKKLIIRDNEIIIWGLFGSTRIPVDEVRLVDGITMGTRQFITISAKKNTFIPNNFDDFVSIIDSVESVVNDNAVGKGLLDLRGHVVTRKSDISMAWITVILLMIIVVIRFFPL
jgi:hypothetical protein